MTILDRAQWTAVDRPDLHTHVCSLSYDFPTRTGTLTMPPDCCTDMGGAIELFRRIDPKVERVQTMAGLCIDTVYFHHAGEWHARDPRYAKP